MSHDHEPAEEHNHDHDHGEDEEVDEVTALIVEAQSGLRSDVQDLVDAIDEVSVFVPLSEDIPGAEDGHDFEVEGGLTFRPHMLLDTDHKPFAVVYTDPSLSEALVTELGWTTSGGDLKFVRVPLQVAFELSQEVVEGQEVMGLVFNPDTDAELVLTREEAASLSQGKALPLVGYVSELPEGPDEETVVIEDADPPPQGLLDVLDEARDGFVELVGYSVKTTFNAERDREPHLTISLVVRPDIDRGLLAERVMEQAAPFLPPPGYADIVFLEASA